MKIQIVVAALLLYSCASAEQKPVSRWDVKVTKQSDQKVWIWKHDGSKQCDTPAQITPEKAAKELKKSGISVFQSAKGSDGMMYPSVCGAGTGATVEVEIPQMDLARAQQLGYRVKSARN